jgi:O-antigen/teichoic acid export membrane protein
VLPLQRATVGCHVVLLAALVASLLPPVAPLRLAAAALLAVPLLLTLRGLARGRRASQQRLAVLLVAYIGGFCVEVVARSGSAAAASVALIAAVLELGLILALIRRSARGPGARE